MDGAAVRTDLVHHIQRQHHRNAQLHHLHGQVEVSLNVGRVYNIDDAVRLVVQQKAAGYDLLAGIRRQRIDAGQVGNGCLRMAADRAVLAVHRNTRKITDMLVGTGQLIEQRRFAAVLVAGQRKRQFFIGSRGFGVLINVVVLGFPELTHAGVRRRTVAYLSGGRLFCSLIRRADFDLPRFIQAQGQFIAAQLKLHRITHRSDLLQRDLGLRRQSHIEQVMA